MNVTNVAPVIAIHKKIEAKEGQKNKGYNIKGDIQWSCMSADKYHVWSRHCNQIWIWTFYDGFLDFKGLNFSSVSRNVHLTGLFA